MGINLLTKKYVRLLLLEDEQTHWIRGTTSIDAALLFPGAVSVHLIA